MEFQISGISFFAFLLLVQKKGERKGHPMETPRSADSQAKNPNGLNLILGDTFYQAGKLTIGFFYACSLLRILGSFPMGFYRFRIFYIIPYLPATDKNPSNEIYYHLLRF